MPAVNFGKREIILEPPSYDTKVKNTIKLLMVNNAHWSNRRGLFYTDLAKIINANPNDERFIFKPIKYKKDLYANGFGCVVKITDRITIYKQALDSNGAYIYVFNNKKRYKLYVHDLVYLIYHPEHTDDKPLKHIDNDNKHNCIDNLTYDL